MIISKRWRSFLIRYGTAIAATLLATLLRELLDPVLEKTAPFSVYYAAVMFTAWCGGLGPALFALVSGAVLADYLFIEPRVSLFASNLEHQVGLGLYLAVGVVVALLCESLHANRRRTEAARAELAEANRGLQKEIAERQQAERWLLESERRFRGYFEQGLVGMAMLSAQRDWLEVNHRVCQMLGYSEAELLSKTWTEVVHPDDLPGEATHFQQMLGGVVPGYVMDQRFVRKDGKILHASLSVQCMRKLDGAVDCILVLVQSVS
jgi:PAS domain S-box-containing protein